MKKGIVFLFALGMMVSCSKNNKDLVVGEWKVSSLQMAGTAIDPELVGPFIYTVKDDGSYLGFAIIERYTLGLFKLIPFGIINYFMGNFKGCDEKMGSHVINVRLVKELQNKLKDISFKIHNEKRQKQNLETTELEDKIDLMVYKLYELTYEEVLVVDKDFGLSEQEYDNFSIK